ncbi:MAG: FmdB family zinc ribbon protein [Actinomycetota bacterium]
MPTYEYACTACERHFDVHQSFHDDPLEVCEVCGGRLRRVFHAVGVLFKGSGFYSTDSRAASSAKKKQADPGSKKTDKPEKPASEAPAKPASPPPSSTSE